LDWWLEHTFVDKEIGKAPVRITDAEEEYFRLFVGPAVRILVSYGPIRCRAYINRR
jgi:hypothetical protein